MTSLTDKLRDLGVQVGTSQVQPPTAKPLPSHSLIDVLPGAWESTSRGDCFVVRKKIPLGIKHGKSKISGLPDMSFFESLDQLAGISGMQPEDYLFIDTETTGLSGGAGTYVFLVGAAKYTSESLDFAQFFLQDPGSESAQLAALDSFSATSKVIVSYNGKSFDLPRIKTRYSFHGWPDPFQDVFHIDLLHLARRLWKPHLPGCSLGDLEYHLLGLTRDNLDIPGWKVSEFFFEYLRSGDPAPLENIFYHNEIDVISLAALLSYLSERLTSPLHKKYQDENDLVSIGKYLFTLQRFEESQKVLEQALANPSLPEPLLVEGKSTLAAIYKRLDDYKSAAEIWKECAALGSLDSLIELAKFAEHKISDYDEAIHWTLTAMDEIENLSPPEHSTFSQQLEHRLNRLKKKAGR